MSAKWCSLCNRNVVPQKKFNWLLFIVLFLTAIGWFLYLLYYFIIKGKKCPICGNKSFSHTH